MDEITVLAPGTVSNVVCGFDCLGFALEEPYDLMVVRKTDQSGVRIIHLDEHQLPTDPSRNVAGVALQAFIEAAGSKHGFEVHITKRIKPGSGIGSSAASAAGAVVAANRLAGDPFSRLELTEIAMAGEMIASGSRHADNLAPCIFGGFVLVRSSDPLDIVELGSPQLFVSVLHPQIQIKTSEARELLPKHVPLADAVSNWSNLGAFVAGLARGDLGLIGRSMVDTIIEPVRRKLILRFDDVMAAGRHAGAIGGGISGSGPSMFMISDSRETADAVASSMQNAYRGSEIETHSYVSRIDPRGVRFA